ncbi:hypothetical protein CLOP_g24403 [Closterium sp. NIES-67]|nr:hypothetical protein CLOP_g24403 [Closterium sp. NIES-67]
MATRSLDSIFFLSVISRRAPIPADHSATARVPASQPARPPHSYGRRDRPLPRTSSISAVCAAPVVSAVWFDEDVDDHVDDALAGWERSSAGRRGVGRRGKRGDNAEQAGSRAARRRGKGPKRDRGGGVADVDRGGERQGSRASGVEGRRVSGSGISSSSPTTGEAMAPVAANQVLQEGIPDATATAAAAAGVSAAAFGFRQAQSTPPGTNQPPAAAAAAWRVVGDGPSSPASPSASFVKPLSTLYPRVPCRVCQDTKLVECACCDGLGTLARGGFQKRNPVSVPRIIGSKWTAMERTFGWRHFRVASKRRMGSTAAGRGRGAGTGEAEMLAERDADGAGTAIIVWEVPGGSASSSDAGSGDDWFVQMVATCDPNTRFWVKARYLKDRKHWAMGWLQKEELQAMGTSFANNEFAGIGTGVNGGNSDGLSKRLVCKACQGQGKIACPRCKELAEMREKERERRRNEGGRDGADDDFQDDGLLEIIEV